MKKKIAIDARELSQKNLTSLGYILLELINRLTDYELLLLSDVEIPSKYVSNNSRVVTRDIKYTGGIDLYKYQSWMKKVMKNEKVDCYFQINHFSVVRTKGIKQIVVVHDLYHLEGIEKHSIKQILVYWISLLGTMVNADKIFTVSEFTKKRLEHFFWKTPKIEVNYNGVDRPQIIPDLDSYACIDGPFCLMLGRVNYYKGTMRAVELFDKYLSKQGYRLVIAGQAKSESVIAQMNEITQRNKNIIWLNYVDDNTKEWLFQNCSLFVYASRYDGFGIPPLEAAIRRKRSIINSIEVLKEVTKGRGNYVDFMADDQSVVDAIVQAFKSEDSRQIEDMYEIAINYTWDKFTDKLIKVIEQ